MESLIFTCLCHAATQLRETRLHPLQLLPVLSAAHDQGEQASLQEAGWAGATGADWGYSPTVSHPADQFSVCHPQVLETLWANTVNEQDI